MLQECKRLIDSKAFGPAAEMLRKLVDSEPSNGEAWNMLGICMLNLGNGAEAEKAFHQVIALLPVAGAAYANLGLALRLQNRNEEALDAFQSAVTLEPGHAANHLQLFKQYQQLSRWDKAIACLEAGSEIHPKSIMLAEALALSYGRMGRPEEAEGIFRAVAPASAQAANSYAKWLQEEGRFEDSVPVLQGSLRIAPGQGEPYRLLTEAKQFSLNGEPSLDSLLGLADAPGLHEKERMHLAYALGRIYDHQRAPDQAMRWFDTANAIAYRTYPNCLTFDPAKLDLELKVLRSLYASKLLQGIVGSSDPRPVFIVGMIRSGTTLLDRIASSHPEVVSVGEGTFWNQEADAIHQRWLQHPPDSDELRSIAERYLDRTRIEAGAARFIDKMPLNFRHLGLIRLAFPEARIIHIRRDPFDTCLSIYFTFFGGGPNFAYSQENIVTFYRSYEEVMAFWRSLLVSDRFLEVDYEGLVSDPEAVSRRVIAFLALPWDDACLTPGSGSGTVPTPSRWQVRQPIYRTSVDKRDAYGPYAGAFGRL